MTTSAHVRENTIQASGLTLRSGTTRGLLGVDLSLLRADTGTARIRGHAVAAEPDRVRELIGLTGR